MRKRWLILAALLLPMAALWIVWRFVYDGADPRQVFFPPPPEAASPAALEESAELHVDRRPFREAIDELARRYDVDIRIDEATLKTVGVSPDAAVSLHAENVTLRTLLQLLARQLDADLVVGEHRGELLVTTESQWINTLNHYTTRIYRLDELLAGAERRIDEATVAEAVRAVAIDGREEDLRAAWSSSLSLVSKTPTGLGEIQVLPGALLVHQRPEVHRRIRALLDGIAQLQRERGRREPLTVAESPDAATAREMLITAIEQPTSLHVKDAPLRDVLATLAKRQGVCILLEDDRRTPFSGAFDPWAKRVTLAANDIRLRSALDHLFHASGQHWVLRDGAILAGSLDTVKPEQPIRLYDVSDLLDDTLPPEKLVALLRHLPVANHSGAIRCVDAMLLAMHTEKVHGRIAQLLAELRRVRRGDAYQPTPLTVERQRILVALEAPANFDDVGPELEEAIRYVLSEHGLGVVFDDRHEWLNYSGVLRRPTSKSHVVIPINQMPLRAALASVLLQEGMRYDVRDETVWITPCESKSKDVFFRCYQLPSRLAACNEKDLLQAIYVIVVHRTAGAFGNSVSKVGDVLVAFQPAEFHERLETLLPLLADAIDHADERTTAIEVVEPPDPLDRLCEEALRRPISLHVEGAPLSDIVRRLAREHDLAIVFDDSIAISDRDMPVTLHADGRSLQTVLDLLVLPLDAQAAPVSGVIAITSLHRDPPLPLTTRPLRLYPVRDLAPRREAARELSDALQGMVHELAILADELASPHGFSHPDRCREVGGVLLVDASEPTHQMVEQLLTATRRVRRDESVETPRTIGPAPKSREAEIWRALDSVTDADFDHVELGEALQSLAARHNLPLWIDDRVVPRERRVRFQLRGATLGRALELLLEPHGLSYTVRAETLVVGNARGYGESVRPQHRVSLHRFGDLREAYLPVGARGLDARISAALYHCSDHRGDVASVGDLLLATGPAGYHRAVERLLTELRRTGDIAIREASPLDRRFTLRCENMPLEEVIARLSRQLDTPILLRQHDAGVVDPFLRDATWRSVHALRVTCRLDDVSVREAIAALAPRETPLTAHLDGGVVIVEPQRDDQKRETTRYYPLDRLLTRLPELDAGDVKRLLDHYLTAVRGPGLDGPDPEDPFWQPGIAVFPSLLVVQHTPAGHAAVEEFLALVEQQADTFPRPYDVVRDDNEAAIGALCGRLAAAEDLEQTIWWSTMATRVEHPPEQLAEAAARAMILANRDHAYRRRDAFRRVAVHCGMKQECVIALWRAELDRDIDAEMRDEVHDDEVRKAALAMLRECGAGGRAVLERRFHTLCDLQSEAPPPEKNLDEIGVLVRLLGTDTPRGPGLIPTLIALLNDEHAPWAVGLLNQWDGEARIAQVYIARRLQDDRLPEQQRRRLKQLNDGINRALRNGAGNPFGGSYVWTAATDISEMPPVSSDPFAP
ncbi:MAG: hypothetical protein RIC55_28745 [Pirellulaceae bacterium]